MTQANTRSGVRNRPPWIAIFAIAFLVVLGIGANTASAQTPTQTQSDCPSAAQAQTTPAVAHKDTPPQAGAHPGHKHHGHHGHRHHQKTVHHGAGHHRHHGGTTATITKLKVENGCLRQQVADLKLEYDHAVYGHGGFVERITAQDKDLKDKNAKIASLSQQLGSTHGWLWGWAIGAIVLGVLFVAALVLLFIALRRMNEAWRESNDLEHKVDYWRQRNGEEPEYAHNMTGTARRPADFGSPAPPDRED